MSSEQLGSVNSEQLAVNSKERTWSRVISSKAENLSANPSLLTANCSLLTVLSSLLIAIRSLLIAISYLLIANCYLLIVNCEQPSGVQSPEGRFTTLEEMASYLVARPENTAETPYAVVLSDLDLSEGLNPLFAGFQGRYVGLDLSACVLRDIPVERNIAGRENKDRLVSLVLPLTLQSVGAYAFYQSSSLVTLVLPDSLRDIGDSAFAECAVEALELPPRLQTLAAGAFAGCPALKRVAIPDSLGALGTYAFALCPSLAECVLPAKPPVLGSRGNHSVFTGSGDLVFFVPDTPSLFAYQIAPSWLLYRYSLALQNPEEAGFEPELYFDYGRRRSPLDDVDSFSYSSPVDRPLVLAPVLWNIPEDAVFVWKLDGQIQGAYAGEYFAFTPREQRSYAVFCSVRVGGRELSATTRVIGTAPEAAVKRPKTEDSRRTVAYCFEFTPAPGGFVGVYPRTDFSEYATEESVRQRSQDKLDGKPVENGAFWNGWSLANLGGYLVTGFDHSVEKRPEGKELYIGGNAVMSAPEPGVVWVMQDSNGNGKPDDLWYELKGSEYDHPLGKHRYAITFFKPQLTNTTSIPWRDNEGSSGLWSGRYPYSVKGASLTFVLSRIQSLVGSGYVDSAISVFSIADAVQADGTPADLAFIDFVKVQSAVYAQSTEMNAPEDTSMPSKGIVIGAALGGGLCRYTFVNRSSQTVTFTVQDQSPFALESGATKVLDLPYERCSWEIGTPGVYVEVEEGVLTINDTGGTT
jgi:hypothetical protein